MVKQYLVFAYGNYYPSGGWSDLYANCDTLEEACDAKMCAYGDHYDCVDIIDLTTGKDPTQTQQLITNQSLRK